MAHTHTHTHTDIIICRITSHKQRYPKNATHTSSSIRIFEYKRIYKYFLKNAFSDLFRRNKFFSSHNQSYVKAWKITSAPIEAFHV